MAPFQIRRLEPQDDRSTFSSGNLELDRFFRLYAGQNQFRHHIGTTYVAVDEQGIIVGFATVSPSEIASSALPAKKLPRYPLPTLRLARLAVDERAKGRGVGSALLRAIFGLAVDMASGLGCVGVVVDAKPEALTFYTKLGFIPLAARAGQLGDRPEPTPMFLEIGAIVAAMT